MILTLIVRAQAHLSVTGALRAGQISAARPPLFRSDRGGARTVSKGHGTPAYTGPEPQGLMMPSVELPSIAYFYAFIFIGAMAGLTFADSYRTRLFKGLRRPMWSHRCRARPLFSELGNSSF